MTSILSNGGDESLFGDVLDEAAAGDHRAVAQLVAEFEPSLIRFAKGQGVNEPEAVVNIALSDAFAGLTRFRGRDRRAFRAYLYQILRRRIVDQYRQGYAQPRTFSGLETDAVAKLVDHEASEFDERLADRDLVEEILNQLTEEQRQVLEMRVLTGLSVKETATMTGRSEGAVKSMQRRALSSLRSVVVAVAVIALGALAVRALLMAGEGVVSIENAPADGSGQGGGDVIDEQSQRPVLEANVAQPEMQALVDESALLERAVPADEPATAEAAEAEPGEDVQPAGSESVDAQESDSQPSNAQPSNAPAGNAPAGDSQPSDAVPVDVEEAETTASSQPGESTGGDSTADEAALPVAPPTADEVSGPSAACTVSTDGTPAKGEVAFVTYNFSGAYELFKGTSVDIIGPAGSSGLIPGGGSVDRVWNNSQRPFVISGNMLVDETLVVKSFLGGRQVKATCDIAEELLRAPCVVRTDGTPEVGETAKISYRTPPRFWTLDGQSTFVVGKGGESAMVDGTEVTFDKDAASTFVISGSMWRDGEFTVKTAFADGASHAVCEIRQ